MNKKLKKILGCTEFYVFLLLVVVGLLIQARSGQFFTSNNIVDIASAMIVPGIFAVGIFIGWNCHISFAWIDRLCGIGVPVPRNSDHRR